MCYIYHVSEVYMRYINLPRGKISPEGDIIRVGRFI